MAHWSKQISAELNEWRKLHGLHAMASKFWKVKQITRFGFGPGVLTEIPQTLKYDILEDISDAIVSSLSQSTHKWFNA